MTSRSLTIDSRSLAESPHLLESCCASIAKDIHFYSDFYPNFSNWFTQQVVPGIGAGERTIILETRSEAIVGILILKHTQDEKKLCTLRVREDYQNKGIGVRLFKTAFEVLQTEAPLLSVCDSNLAKFDRVFDYFGFMKYAEYKGLYCAAVTEHSFNGILSSEARTTENLLMRAHAREKSLFPFHGSVVSVPK